MTPRIRRPAAFQAFIDLGIRLCENPRKRVRSTGRQLPLADRAHPCEQVQIVEKWLVFSTSAEVAQRARGVVANRGTREAADFGWNGASGWHCRVDGLAQQTHPQLADSQRIRGGSCGSHLS